MSVEVNFIGRLGNNLFQYALGRIIAEHLGFELICQEFPVPQEVTSFIQDTQTATLYSVASHFINAPMHIPGKSHSDPATDFVMDSTGAWSGQTIDLAGILADPSPRRIRLLGWFQRYEYYKPYLDQIRTWFAVSPGTDGPEITADDVLVNIRGGRDFSQLGWALDPSYYVSALEQMSRAGRVFVCGVGIDTTVREALAPFDPVYVSGTPMDNLRFIQRFNRIVASNSTFSWWAALLSSAREIYVPQLADTSGYSFKVADIDLEVDDGRYIKIPCSFAPGTRTIEWRQGDSR